MIRPSILFALLLALLPGLLPGAAHAQFSLSCRQLPAASGDVGRSAGSCAETVNTVLGSGVANGFRNPKNYGAWGDFQVDGGGDCSMASGSAVLTCTGSHFAATDLGKEIFVPAAGSAGGTATLDTTIAGYASGTQVTLAATAVHAASAVNIGWGHDDTAALQAAYNAGGTLYLCGGYLSHGLNATGGDSRGIVGCSRHQAGISFVDATNPGGSSSATRVGLDLSGSCVNEVRGVGFYGGFAGAQDMAPQVLVLAGRTGNSGCPLAIEHVLDNLWLNTYGQYGLVLYGWEQTSIKDLHSEQNGSANGGNLYISGANTPGFASPWTSLVSPPTSMTKVSVFGADTAFGTPVGSSIVLDNTTGAENVYQIAIRDAYANLGGSATAFLTNTNASSTGAIRSVTLRDINIEAFNASSYAVNLTVPAWMWSIDNVSDYMPGTFAVAPFTFAQGLLSSRVLSDSQGSSTGHALSSPSCRGSILQLGQEQPSASCTDYIALGTGNGTANQIGPVTGPDGGTWSAGGLLTPSPVTSTVTGQWPVTLDGTTSNVTVPAGGMAKLFPGTNPSGLLIITGTNGYWGSGVFLMGDNNPVLIGSNPGFWAVGTSPGAGMSFGWDSTNGYALRNGTGSTLTFSIVFFRTRYSG